jgi:hypothetical protein
MILFPIPDRMTNPDGCEASFEHFARVDLVGQKMDFKRPAKKNQQRFDAAANRLERNLNFALTLRSCRGPRKISREPANDM